MTTDHQPEAAGQPRPVSVARDGFTPEQAADLLSRYDYMETLAGGDVALFFALNINQSLTTASVVRSGEVVMLESAPDPALRRTRVQTDLGDLSLADYLVHPQSRAQGMVVVHRGRIVLEEYPGMRDFDYKMWMSNAKTTTSLVIALLAEDGTIDVADPIDRYLPELRDTEWAGTRVLDVLDMASGMEIHETQEYRLDPHSIIARVNFAFNGTPNAEGEVERQFEVICSARREKPAGQAFDYSSVNTLVLVRLAEAVEGKRWYEIFRERVWSKMTVEGDLLVGLSPDGFCQAQGMLASRLRDLARFGMLYTPSWHLAARERIVSDDLVREIQTGGRPELFLGGEMGHRLTESYFPTSPPVANHWQWDGVFADGDIYKSGMFSQGLYVSPAKDLVIVWFSTILHNDLTQYARQIALATAPAPPGDVVTSGGRHTF